MKKLSNFPWTIVILAVTLSAGAGYGFSLWQKGGKPSIGERYRSAPIKRGDLAQNVSANGTLNPVVLVNVGTQVSGTVFRLHADFNQRVKAGQVLAELDPALLNASEAQSLANLSSSEASLRLAITNEERMRQLFSQEYVSRQELDQAVQTREVARAQVRLHQAQLERDRTNLRYTVIRSPVSGVVVDRQVNIGQTVAASFQTPTLFRIAQDLKQMQIDSSVAEADVGSISISQAAEFRVDAFPEREFKGTVKQIRLNPTVTSNVVTYNVVVEVANPEELLLPGMTAYLTIETTARSGVLMLPNAALRFKPEDAQAKRGEDKSRKRSGPQVWTVRGEKLAPVEIKTGISDGRHTEILSGELSEGDKVVVEDLKPSEKKESAPRMRMF
ncbi:MAG: efflux RND transporter periplasmic adaptor subunit [Burkholderiales bacterium]